VTAPPVPPAAHPMGMGAPNRPPLPVPVGTPGRDANVALPPPSAPGNPLPPRRYGPGARTRVLIVTVVGCVILAAVAAVSLVFGTVNKMNSKGHLVLRAGQYRLDADGTCSGTTDFAAARTGAVIVLEPEQGDSLSARISGSTLRSGACYLNFEVSGLSATEKVYQPRIGSAHTTPVTGSEIRSGSFNLFPVAE
jgi:hypothetical protein